MQRTKEQKIITLLLCVFFGAFGVHKFYQGKKGIGFLYLFTLGFFGIGWMIDIVICVLNLLHTPKANTPTKTAPPPPVRNVRPPVPPLRFCDTSPRILPPREVDFTIPSRKDGAPLRYHYSVKTSLLDRTRLLEHYSNKELLFNAIEKDGAIHLFMGNDDIAILMERVDMLRDWISRGDPYLIVFEQTSSETDCTVHIAFYRDKRKQLAYREQNVVALQSYKAGDRQDAISYLEEGDELEFEDDDSVVNILTSSGEIIGKLPAKYANRFVENGAVAVFYEKFEYDDGDSNLDFKQRPYVRIYW